MWLDLIPNNPRQRVMCQVKGCDRQATLLHAELLWGGYRFRCTALCQDHALDSQDSSRPVLQLDPISIVEQEPAEIK